MGRIHSKWKNVPKPLRIILWTILGILGVAAMGVIFGFGIMWLWNWLMPAIFGLGEITYWQAVGIFVLAKVIFGFGTKDSDSKSPKSKKEHWEENGSCSNWGAYDSWWETEGKKSFEKYKEQKPETSNQ